MTVSSLVREAKSACNGVTTIFPVPFQYIDSADLLVSLLDGATNAETPLNEGVDYELSGTPAAGDVELVTLAVFPNGKVLWRRRNTVLTQEAIYTPNDGLPAKTLEGCFDKLTMIAQEQAASQSDFAARALAVPIGSLAPVMPSPAALAGKFLTVSLDGLSVVPSAGTGADAGLRTDLASTIGAGLVALLQSVAGAQVDTVQRKLSERISLMDFIPANLRAGVIAGTNATDLAPYINAALALGGTIDTLTYSYRIRSRLIPTPGTHLVGLGTFVADPLFSDATYADGINTMLKVVSFLTVDRGIVFDGNSIPAATLTLWGARNFGSVANVTLDAEFRNLSFTGIDISRNNGGWANSSIKVRGYIHNVGWTGANLEGVTDLNHDNLTVESTGWVGILVTYSFNVRGDGFYVNKAAPPYTVYAGAGNPNPGVEGGFMFAHFSVNIARWTNFLLYDNRNAASDGFGIGEDGPLADPESANIYVTGQIWYAGLFGFDVSSDMEGEIQVWNSAQQGVQLGFDLGGTLANVDLKVQVYNNQAAEGVRFSASGAAPRTVSITNGSTAAVITAGAGFSVVKGQRVTGAGIPANTTASAIFGNAVTLSNAATATNAAAALVFRGVVNFSNVRIDVRTANCIDGLGVESGSDGFTTYAGCEVTGDLSGVNGNSVALNNGNYPSGFRLKNCTFATAERGVSGATFAAVAHDTFVYTGGGTLNGITNGYEKQEITVYINTTATTLNFDWTNASGQGANRLIGSASLGAGNTDVTINPGGMFKARYRATVGWYVYALVQAQ